MAQPCAEGAGGAPEPRIEGLLAERLGALEAKCDRQLELLAECLARLQDVGGRRRHAAGARRFATRAGTYDTAQSWASASPLLQDRGRALRFATEFTPPVTVAPELSMPPGEPPLVFASMVRTSVADPVGSFLRRRRERNQWKHVVWQFLEDRDSSRAARIYSYVYVAAVLWCVLISWRFTHKDPKAKARPGIMLDILQLFLFVEPVVRFAVCPNRLTFLCNIHNWIDCVVALQILARAYLRLHMRRTALIFALRVFMPACTLLKLLRRFEHVHLLMSAFATGLEALPVLLFTLLVIALLSSSVLLLVEPEDNIKTLSGAMWLSTMTITTVGYGDLTPVTWTGRVVTGVLAVIASLYFAMPIGMVGNAFGHVWDDRERLMLIARLREKVSRSGVTPDELSGLLVSCDHNSDGFINVRDLQAVMRAFEIHLSDQQCAKVLEGMDTDLDGKVAFGDLMSIIFPEHRMFVSRISGLAPPRTFDPKTPVAEVELPSVSWSGEGLSFISRRVDI